MKGLLAIKDEMTHVYSEKGDWCPVTRVRLVPCVVTQVKNGKKDGYTALQLGCGEKKHPTRASRGHLKDIVSLREGRGFRFMKEIRIDHIDDIERGSVLDPLMFEKGEHVEVTGWSKGKGFAGVVKRHHFHGHPTSHGHKDQERMPGAIGSGGVQRVFKGLRMAGRMGSDQVTVKNLEIVDIDSEKGVMLIKGALPGARNGLVLIKGAGSLKCLPIKDTSTQTQTEEEQRVRNHEQVSDVVDSEEQGEKPSLTTSVASAVI